MPSVSTTRVTGKKPEQVAASGQSGRFAHAKISSKGQLTVPAAMRAELGTNRVRLVMLDKQITVVPEDSLYGCLAQYAKPMTETWAEQREKAWALEMGEKHEKHHRR